jgi:hypothetical protein
LHSGQKKQWDHWGNKSQNISIGHLLQDSVLRPSCHVGARKRQSAVDIYLWVFFAQIPVKFLLPFHISQ